VEYFVCNVTRLGERGATSGWTGWFVPVSCLHLAEGRPLFTASNSSVPAQCSAAFSAKPKQPLKITLAGLNQNPPLRPYLRGF
jgi:hypothetical protein